MGGRQIIASTHLNDKRQNEASQPTGFIHASFVPLGNELKIWC